MLSTENIKLLPETTSSWTHSLGSVATGKSVNTYTIVGLVEFVLQGSGHVWFLNNTVQVYFSHSNTYTVTNFYGGYYRDNVNTNLFAGGSPLYSKDGFGQGWA